VETETKRVLDRLAREGWVGEVGTKHSKFAHPGHPGVRIMVPRHRVLTEGVARSIAKAAGWI
jgi:hypothetical protein